MKPESSQNKPANTCSRMGGQGDDYAVVHERLEESARELNTHTWESLDAPRYDPEEEDEESKTDLVEEFFDYLFTYLHSQI